MKEGIDIKEVESVVRNVLGRDKNIVAAYIYGFAARGAKRPGDIDIGCW